MTDQYYDPYDVEIDADPYPVYKWLRDEAPSYYNGRYDFYVVSRFEDCRRGLADAKRHTSGRGGILELIKANIEMPPGTLIFEDPPVHTIHRGLLSRVFTPAAGGRTGAADPQLLRPKPRGPRRSERVRPGRRLRRADADACDRHAVRHPRGRP